MSHQGPRPDLRLREAIFWPTLHSSCCFGLVSLVMEGGRMESVQPGGRQQAGSLRVRGQCHSALLSPPSPSGHQCGRSLICCSLWASPTGNYSARLRAGRTYFPFLLEQVQKTWEETRQGGVRKKPHGDQGHRRPEPYLSHLHVESFGYGGIPALPEPGPGNKGPGPPAGSPSAL